MCILKTKRLPESSADFGNKMTDLVSTQWRSGLDIVRIVAIFCVVCVHVSADFWNPIKNIINSPEWTTCCWFDAIAHIGVPLFVMITGSVTLGRAEGGYTFKKCCRRALRFLCILLFWSAIYSLQRYLKQDFPSKTKIAVDILTGQSSGHLWYLYMIIGLYLLIPIMDVIVRNNKTADLFLLLFFAFAVMIPLLRNVFEIIQWKHSSDVLTIIDKTMGNVRMHLPLSYPGLAILGYRLTNRPFSKKSRWILYGAAVLSAVFLVAGTEYHSAQMGSRWENLFNNFSLPIIIVSMAVFSALSHISNFPRESFRAKLLRDVALSSFGVYLIHVLLLRTAVYQTIAQRIPTMIVRIPVMTIALYLVSLAVISVLKRIPLIRRTVT